MVTRIYFTPWVPWTIPLKEGNVTNLGGIARDFYDTMKITINLNFKLTLQEDLIFGSLGPNGIWTGMLGGMQRNESDISGPYFITEERATLVDFSVPISFSQLSIMSGLVPANRDPLLIFRIFSFQVWLLTVFSTLLASGAASLIYSMTPSQPDKPKSGIYLKYLWMFYGTLLGKDFGSETRWFLNHVLAAASFRLLLCAWLIGPALVLMYTYQGAITSTFAADKLKPKIETMEELQETKSVMPGTFKNSFPSACFKRLKGTSLDSLSQRVRVNYTAPGTDRSPEWLDDVENGKLAFVAEIVTLKSMVGERFREKGRCGIYVTPVDFCTAYIAFAFRSNYRPKLQQKFNKRLLWYNEGRLYQRRIYASLANYDICTRVSSGTTKPLELIDLLGAFIVYFTGLCVSVFIFFLERVVQWRKSFQK